MRALAIIIILAATLTVAAAQRDCRTTCERIGGNIECRTYCY